MAARRHAIRFLRRMWFCATPTLRRAHQRGVGAKDDFAVLLEDDE
jgi:hypothetical protein